MYSIRTIYTLNAKHALMRKGKPVEEPHLHAFKVEVECSSEKLDDSGCVVDFRDFDNRVADTLGAYTGTDLHQHQRFAGKSPSAESMAEAFFADIKSCMMDMPVRLERVTVWEDECHAGSYRGE